MRERYNTIEFRIKFFICKETIEAFFCVDFICNVCFVLKRMRFNRCKHNMHVMWTTVWFYYTVHINSVDYEWIQVKANLHSQKSVKIKISNVFLIKLNGSSILKVKYVTCFFNFQIIWLSEVCLSDDRDNPSLYFSIGS